MADQSQSRIQNPASWLVIWIESQSNFLSHENIEKPSLNVASPLAWVEFEIKIE